MLCEGLWVKKNVHEDTHITFKADVCVSNAITAFHKKKKTIIFIYLIH